MTRARDSPGGPKPPVMRGCWDSGAKALPDAHFETQAQFAGPRGPPHRLFYADSQRIPGLPRTEGSFSRSLGWDLAGVPRVLTQPPGPGRKADSASELSGGRCRHAHPLPRRPGAPLLTVRPSTGPARLPSPPRPRSAPDPVSPAGPATRKGPPATRRKMAPSPHQGFGARRGCERWGVEGASVSALL